MIYKSAIRKDEVGSSLREGKAFSGAQGSKKLSLVYLGVESDLLGKKSQWNF